MQCLKHSKTLLLNVSGSKFEVGWETLLNHPTTRLGKLASSNEASNSSEIFFDRSAASFESILNFYRTGKLHLPTTMCPNVFKDELEFWDIDYTLMEQCCLLNFIQFMDSYKTKAEFDSRMRKLTAVHEWPGEPMTIKRRIWNILEYKETSRIAKLFMFVGIAFVLISVTTLALGSLPQYRRTLTSCEWQEYIAAGDDIELDVLNYFNKHDCNSLQLSVTGDIFSFYYYDYEYYYDYHYDNNDTTQSSNGTDKGETLNTSFPNVTLKNDIIHKIDYVVTAYFTLELLIRLLVSPSFKICIISFLNIIDSIVLIGAYFEIIIRGVKTQYKFSPTFIDIIDFIKLLRVIRLLRFCQHLAAVQVLRFSFRQNAKDLIVLLIHILIIVLIFSNIIFLFETRDNVDSIPQGWWLGFITLTTVGYGDLAPKTFAGKLVCSLCALCGIMMLSLIIPIFVDTFVSLYTIAQIRTTDRVNTSENLTKVQNICKKQENEEKHILTTVNL